MSNTKKISIPARFINGIISGQQTWHLLNKKVSANDVLELIEQDTKRHFANVPLSEAVQVEIGIGNVTISSGVTDELPYNISNRDGFAQASGFADFDDLKSYILDENPENLPKTFILAKWVFSDVKPTGQEEKPAKSSTKKDAQKPDAKSEKANADDKAKIEGGEDSEIDAAIKDAEKRLSESTDPLEKDSITAEIAALKAQKDDGDDNAK